jgi:hypothetical protein
MISCFFSFGSSSPRLLLLFVLFELVDVDVDVNVVVDVVVVLSKTLTAAVPPSHPYYRRPMMSPEFRTTRVPPPHPQNTSVRRRSQCAWESP